MRLLICYLFPFLPFFLRIHAFKVTFYEKEDNCAGESIGNWIGGDGQGCNTFGVGQAGAATIQSTGPVDDNTLVTFYSTDNCAFGTDIASGDFGCLGIDGEASGSYRSFMVVGDPGGTTPFSVSVPPLPSATPKSLSTAKIGRSDRQTRRHQAQNKTSEVTTSDGLKWNLPYNHAELREWGGVVYKWQQVHAIGYRGILPEHWDDDIHVKNDAEIPMHVVNHDFISGNGTTNLDKRLFNVAICKLAVECVRRAPQNAINIGVTVYTAIGPWVAQVVNTAVALNRKANEFAAEQPFISGIIIQSVGSTVGSFIGTPVQAVAQGKLSGSTTDESLCTTSKDTMDALLEAIQDLQGEVSKLANAIETSTVQTAPTDVTHFQFRADACGQSTTGSSCGMTGPFC